jgi:hypothetical protein
LNSRFGFCLTQTLIDPADKALRAQSLGRPRKREPVRGDSRRLGERSASTGLARLGQRGEVGMAVREPSVGGGGRRRPRHCATNSDQAGRVTKDQSGSTTKGAGTQRGERKRKERRWADWAKTG